MNKRQWLPGEPHFVEISTSCGRVLSPRTVALARLERVFRESGGQRGVRVLAFSGTDRRVRVVGVPEVESSFPSVLQGVLSGHARWQNRAIGEPGHLFRAHQRAFPFAPSLTELMVAYVTGRALPIPDDAKTASQRELEQMLDLLVRIHGRSGGFLAARALADAVDDLVSTTPQPARPV